MIEVLKKMYQLLLTEPHAPAVCDQLEPMLREAIAELESQEPVAWDLADKVRQDLDRQSCPDAFMRIAVESIVKHHPPQPAPAQEPVDYEKLAALGWQAIECGICGGGAMGYPQRTWVGLTEEEFHEACWESYVDPVTGECSTGDRALILAITAPDDFKAQQAIELSEDLAMRLNSAEVDKCKADALLILEMA
jgi:hypothetical protein